MLGEYKIMGIPLVKETKLTLLRFFIVWIFSYLIVNLIKHIFFKIYAWNKHKKVKPQTTDYKNISGILRVSFNVIKMQLRQVLY